jgi:Holliday junction resolvase RusA-like endonuclease
MVQAYHLFNKWMGEARAELESRELFDIYIPIVPIGKGRPRGQHQTPEKTRTWTDYFASVVADDMRDKPTIWFPCAARIVAGLAGKRLPDIDNWEKALWDALQRGDKRGKLRAIQDDKLVRGYVEKAERTVAKGNEFIWVRFYALSVGDYVLYEKVKDSYDDNDNDF